MKTSRLFYKAFRALVVLGALTVACPAARAQIIPPLLINAAPVGVGEDNPSVSLTFQVQNPNPFPLIVDFAMWSEAFASGDKSDAPTGIGWPTADLTIAGGGTGNYSITMPLPNEIDYDDQGVTSVSFEIELSPLDGKTPPPVNTVTAANSGTFWLDETGNGDLPQQPAENMALNGQDPFPNLLYADGVYAVDANGNHIVTSQVTVYDIPEPDSLLLLGIGALGLLGYVVRRRMPRA